MIKNFKKFFVSVFILIFSSVCLVNVTTFSSFFDYSSGKSYGSCGDNTYENLHSLHLKTITSSGTTPSEFSDVDTIKILYSLVCKNLFYLIDSKEKYCELHQILNNITDFLFGRSLSEPLVLGTSEEYPAITLYDVSIVQILQSRLSLFKENLDLFDAMFAYSCIPEEAPTSAKTYLRIILVLNKIDPETLLFYEG